MIIDFNELKKAKEEKLQEKLADILRECRDLDKQMYSTAKAQVESIEEALETDESKSDIAMLFVIGKEYYTISLDHVDVANEIFCAMENIKHLAE